MKIKNQSSVWAGVIAAFAASSCCILPLLAAVGGASSSFASSSTWIEPLRPYLMAATLGLFGFAFYRAYRQKVADDCDCDVKPPFWQSKGFLWLVFGLSLLLMTFPYYAKVFYPSSKTDSVETAKTVGFQTITVNIEGMTCTGCEEHVNSEVSKVEGVASSKTSYEAGNSIVQFDPVKTNVEAIFEAINKTGYVPTGLTETQTKTQAKSNR